MNTQQHNMVLEETHPSGAEKWYCPTCGRCLLINWKPRFMRIILEAGDEFANHSGCKGGLGMGSIQVQVATKDEPALQESLEVQPNDVWLTPWVEWLNEVDFEKLWNE